jgi:hypothetical protein
VVEEGVEGGRELERRERERKLVERKLEAEGGFQILRQLRVKWGSVYTQLSYDSFILGTIFGPHVDKITIEGDSALL